MTNWYSSKMNYDMLSQFPTDTMNLHMNQLWDNSKALSNLYTFPSYEFGNFTPYGGINSNSYLTNPMYSVKQSTWGTPAWNNGLPFMNTDVSNLWNNSGNMWGNMGWNGGNTNGSSNDSNLSAEEKGFQRKHNALMSLVKQLKDYDGLTNEEQDELNVAVRGTKGTWEERYDALKEAYDKVDKSTVKKFLAEGGYKLGVSKDINGSEKDKESFYNRLLACGYEYENALDDKLVDFHSGIQNISDKNANDSTVKGMLGFIAEGEIDVLDLVSSWNSNYNKGDNAEKRIIKYIAKYYNGMKDKDMKDDVKTGTIKPLVDAMTKKANSVKKSLDENSKTKIGKAIEKLNKEYDAIKTDGKINDSLSNAFDEVYLLLRQAAMTKLRNDAKKQYGDIDSEVFNDKLFEDETVKDLKGEGFSDSQIKGTEVKISEKKKTTKADKEAKADKDENAEEVKETKETEETESDSESIDNFTPEEIVKYNKNADDETNKPEAWKNGEKIADLLIGATSKENRIEAKKIINNITAKDVFVTLAGYEDDDALGDDIIAQLVTESNFNEKSDLIKHILVCAKANLEGQLEYNKDSKNKDADKNKVSELNKDIASLKNYIDKGVKDEKTADKVDKILAKYTDEAFDGYNMHCGFAEACESIGNFFQNLFDWA